MNWFRQQIEVGSARLPHFGHIWYVFAFFCFWWTYFTWLCKLSGSLNRFKHTLHMRRSACSSNLCCSISSVLTKYWGQHWHLKMSVPSLPEIKWVRNDNLPSIYNLHRHVFTHHDTPCDFPNVSDSYTSTHKIGNWIGSSSTASFVLVFSVSFRCLVVLYLMSCDRCHLH